MMIKRSKKVRNVCPWFEADRKSVNLSSSVF